MDETYDTIARINEKFNKMSKSHKKLATFVIDHYEQAAFMTAAKMAKTVDISEATVVRFAYALEYDGYPEFQASLANWVKKKLNSVQSIGAKYGSSTQAEILTSVLSADIEKIEDTIEHIDAQALKPQSILYLGQSMCILLDFGAVSQWHSFFTSILI